MGVMPRSAKVSVSGAPQQRHIEAPGARRGLAELRLGFAASKPDGWAFISPFSFLAGGQTLRAFEASSGNSWPPGAPAEGSSVACRPARRRRVFESVQRSGDAARKQLAELRRADAKRRALGTS